MPEFGFPGNGNHANIAMLQTLDGHGRLELFEYIHPRSDRVKPDSPQRDWHAPRRFLGRDVYKLTYIRGPSGIIVMPAEQLKKN
ncbi:hypothetical protein GCM10027052_05390 [Parafrigoribacterium mesophilum]